jgi:hypothetical protein
VQFVYTQEGARWVKTPVRAGRRSDTQAEIRAGLKEGTVVLLREPAAGETITRAWDPEQLKVAGYKIDDEGRIIAESQGRPPGAGRPSRGGNATPGGPVTTPTGAQGRPAATGAPSAPAAPATTTTTSAPAATPSTSPATAPEAPATAPAVKKQ